MSNHKVRAKMYVSNISASVHTPNGAVEGKIVKLSVVTSGSEENKSFSKWTPSGSVELYINNPEALEYFELGKEYYVDFEKVYQKTAKNAEEIPAGGFMDKA